MPVQCSSRSSCTKQQQQQHSSCAGVWMQQHWLGCSGMKRDPSSLPGRSRGPGPTCRSGWSWPMAASAAASKRNSCRHWRACWLLTLHIPANMITSWWRPRVGNHSTCNAVCYNQDVTSCCLIILFWDESPCVLQAASCIGWCQNQGLTAALQAILFLQDDWPLLAVALSTFGLLCYCHVTWHICTGLANPGPIMAELWTDEELEAAVVLDGVVTVIDGR